MLSKNTKICIMKTRVAALLLCASFIGSCNSSLNNTNSSLDGTCDFYAEGWRIGNVEPPGLVKIWNVDVRRDDVALNGVAMSDQRALKNIEATKDYDPGAYVLLDKGASSCNRVETIALQINNRFNCTKNYCYVIDENSHTQ